MSIIGRSLWANKTGLRVVELDGLEFAARLPVPTDVPPPLVTTDDLITVPTNGATVFTLADAPEPGSIPAVLKDGLVFFEPTFAIDGDTFTWHGPSLAAGEQFRVVNFGGGTASGHMRLEKITITEADQRELRIDGTPVGPHTVVYKNGKAYPARAGFARTTNNVVDWLHPLVKLNPGDQVYVYYARTLEASQALITETFPLSPLSSHVLQLAEAPNPPENTTLVLDDVRYHYGIDFSLTGTALAVDPGIVFKHGSYATVQYTKQPALVLIPGSGDGGQGGTPPPPPPSLPAVFFIRSVVPVDTDGQLAITLTNAPNVADKSVAAVNGLVFVEDFGYSRAGGAVTWEDPDLALDADDTFQLAGLSAAAIGNGIGIKELTGVAAGEPTLALGEAAQSISKSLVIISAGDSQGGLVYAGDDLLFPTNDAITWTGPFPLKATDRAFAIFFKSAEVAAAMRLEVKDVGAGEAGPAFSTQLTNTPAEGANLFAFMNGEWLVAGADFTLSGKTFTLTRGGGTVKQGDRFIFWFH